LIDRLKEGLKNYGRNAGHVLSHPAWWGSIVICTVGLVATSTGWARKRWRYGPITFVGALGTGVMFGVLAPLDIVGRGAAAAAAVSQSDQPASVQPRSRAAVNKTFEPAQGTESAGVFVGQ
jgi:hypothetical protein